MLAYTSVLELLKIVTPPNFKEVEKFISPDTSNVYPGVVYFIPSLSFVVSQWRFVSDCIVPVPLPINSLFYVKVVAPVPPFDKAITPE